MWKRPWGYAEGWAICGGLLITGFLLQWTLGKVNVDIYRYPVNVICGIGWVCILILLSVGSKKIKALRWFSSLEASLTALSSLLIIIIGMGLTRQVSPEADLSHLGGIAWLGLMQMTVSWPFLFLFLYFISILGLVTLRRLFLFRLKDVGFICNHLGLFLALTTAVLGSGDLQRLQMTVQTEGTEWRAMNMFGELVEMPLAIELKSFTIEEYPPKLMVLDNVTGKPLPEGHAENLVAEEVPVTGVVNNWQLEVVEFLPMAACFLQQDTVRFVEFHTPGATSAVYVKAVHQKEGTLREGWVSAGNHMFPYTSLKLNEQESLIMPQPEPRRFTSDVTVYTEQGEVVEAMIDVNKPLSVAGWKIYQVSYDESMGKWSTISVFELVRDPWMPFVYTGIFLMLAGALFLFITAPVKKKNV